MENREFGLPLEQQPEKQKGCFTWGRCLGCSVVVILLICGGGIGFIYFGYHWLTNKFLEDKPIEVEELAYTEDEVKAVQNKVEEFQKQLEEKGSELVLTEKEANTLVLAKVKKDSSWIRRFRIKFLEGGKVEVRCALEFQKNRYLNIHVKGKLEINNGIVKLSIDEGQVGKVEVPKLYEDQLSQMINDRIKEDPQTKAEIDKIEKLTIEKGKAKIKLKKLQGQAAKTKTAA